MMVCFKGTTPLWHVYPSGDRMPLCQSTIDRYLSLYGRDQLTGTEEPRELGDDPYCAECRRIEEKYGRKPNGTKGETALITTLDRPTTGNPQTAAKLRKLAESMEKQIQQQLNPGTAGQNPTPRRMAIIAGMRQEGLRLEKIQQKLTGLANAHEASTVPASLAGIQTRAAMEDLLSSWVKEPTAGLVKSGVHTAADLAQARTDLAAMESGPSRLTPEALRLKELEAALVGKPIPGYFPTPRAVVEQMLDLADICPGDRVLEPSAGKGNIADLIREQHPDCELTVVEYNHQLYEILTCKGYAALGRDFLVHSGEYDRVLMNPPFEAGQDMEHVQHAYGLLAPGGRLVAIMSEGVFFRQTKKEVAFREWLASVYGTAEQLPTGSFKSSERPTGVATRLVVIDKQD